MFFFTVKLLNLVGCDVLFQKLLTFLVTVEQNLNVYKDRPNVPILLFQ